MYGSLQSQQLQDQYMDGSINDLGPLECKGPSPLSVSNSDWHTALHLVTAMVGPHSSFQPMTYLKVEVEL